jgi:MAP kinase interacting serine/threonine kinase
MFYFEDDNGENVVALAAESRAREGSMSSVSTTSSQHSTGRSNSITSRPLGTTGNNSHHGSPAPLSKSQAIPTSVGAGPIKLTPKGSTHGLKILVNQSTPSRKTGSDKNSPSLASSPNTKRGRTRRTDTVSASTFHELYELRGEFLGRGAYASVRTCVSALTGKEYAVKIIEKRPGHSRGRVIKEIQLFNHCHGHSNIVQLIEFFEEADRFYLIFEKMRGGPLLNHIQRRVYFTEQEASLVVRDIATALSYLHAKGIAHRDIKPENILCEHLDRVSPVKLCDLDLASKAGLMAAADSVKTPELQSPVGSAEFMAPEVVDAFVGEALHYDKRCDMWSLGVILYIMLCGYPPFYGDCWRDNCGWDQGEQCSDCQEALFARIQLGEFDFPKEDWARISDSAIDLIQHLLVKDAKQRYTADEVMNHRWINEEAPKTPLQTPDVLLRKDSARDLQQMHENFSALGRIELTARLSNAFGTESRLTLMQAQVQAAVVQQTTRRKASPSSTATITSITPLANSTPQPSANNVTVICAEVGVSMRAVSPALCPTRGSDDRVTVKS